MVYDRCWVHVSLLRLIVIAGTANTDASVLGPFPIACDWRSNRPDLTGCAGTLQVGDARADVRQSHTPVRAAGIVKENCDPVPVSDSTQILP